jgi:serine/threonine protein kinase
VFDDHPTAATRHSGRTELSSPEQDCAWRLEACESRCTRFDYGLTSLQSNIVVRLVNQKPRAALLDFGTAVVGDKTALRFTTYQYFAGTRDWAPPEETTIAPPQMGIGDMIDVLTLAHDVDPLTEGAMYELIHGAPAERRPRSTAARDVWAFGQLCLFVSFPERFLLHGLNLGLDVYWE